MFTVLDLGCAADTFFLPLVAASAAAGLDRPCVSAVDFFGGWRAWNGKTYTWLVISTENGNDVLTRLTVTNPLMFSTVLRAMVDPIQERGKRAKTNRRFLPSEVQNGLKKNIYPIVFIVLAIVIVVKKKPALYDGSCPRPHCLYPYVYTYKSTWCVHGNRLFCTRWWWWCRQEVIQRCSTHSSNR